MILKVVQLLVWNGDGAIMATPFTRKGEVRLVIPLHGAGGVQGVDGQDVGSVRPPDAQVVHPDRVGASSLPHHDTLPRMLGVLECCSTVTACRM